MKLLKRIIPILVLAVLTASCGILEAKWVINPYNEYEPPDGTRTFQTQTVVKTRTNSPPYWGVTGISAGLTDKGIKITWQSPVGFSNGIFRLYRKNTPISQKSDLDTALLLAELPVGVTTYTDSPTETGSYWYAVMSVLLSADPSFPYMGKSAIQYPIDYLYFARQKSRSTNLTAVSNGEEGVTNSESALEETPVSNEILPQYTGPSNIRVLLITNVGIQVAWNSVITNNTSFDLYRSTNQFIEGVVPPEPAAAVTNRTVWTDRPAQQGNYSYAVVQHAAEREPSIVKPGRTATLVPLTWVVKPASNIVVIDEEAVRLAREEEARLRARGFELDFTNTAKKYFDQRKFTPAERELTRILKDRDCPEAVRRPASLMLGKTYYYQGKSEEALKIFVSLLKIYPEEANFWINLIGRQP